MGTWIKNSLILLSKMSVLSIFLTGCVFGDNQQFFSSSTIASVPLLHNPTTTGSANSSPSPTATPSFSKTPIPTSTPVHIPTPTPTVVPTITPTPSPAHTPIATPTATPTPAATATPGPIICDPLGSGGFATAQSGVQATLKYLPSNTYSWNTSSSAVSSDCNYGNPNSLGCPDGLNLNYAYMNAHGLSEPATFYFSDINVVPQEFILGFPTGNGTSLKDNSGDVLTSYFSLDFQGQIQLSANQPSGWYQFATISDDGSILNLDTTGSGQLTPMVNNDYWHGAIMQCATTAIYMTPHQPIKMDLQYFQGAPVTISMMVLWRQVSSQNPPADAYCGATNIPLNASGNPVLTSTSPCSGVGCANRGGPDYFTQTTSGSTQNPLFADLLGSGAGVNSSAWQVLNSSNYLLPAASAPNPCVTGP